MGNEQSNFSDQCVTSFQWSTVQPKRTNIPGTPSLCRTKNHNLEADCYDIAVLGTLEEQMQSLLRRRSLPSKYIPILLDMRVKQKQMFECNMSQRLEVYTQKIICRLNDVELLQKEALYTLGQCLKAFFQLHRYSNTFFTVCMSMIGFNENGQFKVWLHQIFGRSEIQQDSLARTEYQMLISIIRCFQPFGIRVQDYYSYSKFQQIINHLSKQFDSYLSSQLHQSIIIKVLRTKKEQQMNTKYPTKICRKQSIDTYNNRPHSQDNINTRKVTLKENINPFKQRQNVYYNKSLPQGPDLPHKHQSQILQLYRPVSTMTENRQTFKHINISTMNSSLKSINLNASYDQSIRPNSSYQLTQDSNSTSQPSMFITSTLPNQHFNRPVRQKISFKSRPNEILVNLRGFSKKMSRITERSNEEEGQSILKVSSISRPHLGSQSKISGIGQVQLGAWDDYLTRMDL